MGEMISQPTFDFNRAIRVEVRPERVSADGGAVLIREIMHRLKIDRWLGNHLIDFRREELVTHPWLELLRTKLILLCQGWRDNDDADFLRHDPALRLAVSERRGDAALFPGCHRQCKTPQKWRSKIPHPRDQKAWRDASLVLP